MRASKRARWALVVVAAAALVFAAAAAARTHSTAAKRPIIIGWAHDDQGADGAVRHAGTRRGEDRAQEGQQEGRLGRKIVIKTCKTQGDDPTTSKACADKLIGEHAKVIFTTCDVDLAAPVVQESINHHLLTIAPCIGTDQMGPKRFGKAGKLAFSFGNVAQDEGSAMAELAWKHGWKTADLAKDTAIVYFKAVVTAFKARFKQLGGKIKLRDVVPGPGTRTAVDELPQRGHRIKPHQADVIVTVTAAPTALAPVHHRPADGRRQDADAQLVGGRRDVLARPPAARRSRTTGS